MNDLEARISPRFRSLLALVATAAMAGLIALGGIGPVLGAWALGSLLAFGWPYLIELPNPGTARRAMLAVALVTALVGYYRPPNDLVFVAGAVVIAGFIAEMARRDGRPRLIEQLSGTVSGGMFIVMTGLWIPFGLPYPTTVAYVSLVSIGAGLIAEMLSPRPRLTPVFGGVGTILGSLISLTFTQSVWSVLILGLALSVVVFVSGFALYRLPPASRRRPAIALASFPLCVGGAIAFVAVALSSAVGW